MIDYKSRDGSVSKVTENALWHGPPDDKRLRELEEEFPYYEDWIYRRLPDGTVIKWEFIGLHKLT